MQTSQPTRSPFQLGLSNSPEAIPPLIEFLKNGRPNDRRLAASAIGKLSASHRAECQAAVPALVACLDDPEPQVRQNALKALAMLRLPPAILDRLKAVETGDDRPYNRELARAILQRFAQTPASSEPSPDGRAAPRPADPLSDRIEKCLEALSVLEADLHENLSHLWDAEDELADARLCLEHAEQKMIVRGIEGKNETERRARLAAALPRERDAVETADSHLRFARREQEEFRTSLTLLQQRLRALELLVALRGSPAS